jgi:hypothetical protein
MSKLGQQDHTRNQDRLRRKTSSEDRIKAALAEPSFEEVNLIEEALEGSGWKPFIEIEWEDTTRTLPTDDHGSVVWIKAIREVDQSGRQDKLLALLRSPFSISPIARFHLADLIERYGLKKRKAGRMRVPAYEDGSKAGLKTEFAVHWFKRFRQKGLTRAEAITDASRQAQVDERTIVMALKHSYRPYNELRKRLKKVGLS